MLIGDLRDDPADVTPSAPTHSPDESVIGPASPLDEPSPTPSTGEATPLSASAVQSALAANLQGLGGSGYAGKYNGRNLTITVTSEDPIGTWGYVVPTSADKYYGLHTTSRTSVSMTTTVYGRPAYARVFVQAGYAGTAITCTVRVDGQIMDQRTARGRYVQAMCQG